MIVERTDLQDEALRWAARMDRSDWSEADEASLAVWLSNHPRANGALLRAQASWVLLDLHGFAAAQPVDSGSSIPSRRIVMAGGLTALAASIAALMFSVSTKRYDTQVGEIRRLALTDGSTAAINTDSSIEVDFDGRLRHVRLDRGEAWFQVKPDRARPFLVEAGTVSVRAVGTAFSVRRREGGVDIIVTEGVVSAWTVDSANAPVSASAGMKLSVPDVPSQKRAIVSTPSSSSPLAWRGGQLEFTARPLHEAAAEFNRYNLRKIIIRDPAIANEQIDGIFRTDDPEGFATAVQHLLNVHADFDRRNEIALGG